MPLLSLPFPNPYSLIPTPYGPVTLNRTMPISKDLLDILVCPSCKATVELKPDQSGLKCVQCKRVYPIRDEIPVMLIDEAKVEE
jgi:uncharacterized protein YbaR (Trm112 family)